MSCCNETTRDSGAKGIPEQKVYLEQKVPLEVKNLLQMMNFH